MNESQIRRVFVISILLKGAHATLELLGGALLLLASTQTIVGWIGLLTQNELSEDPQDLIANALLNAAHGLSIDTKSFYAWYLLIHGAVKVVLVLGLLRRHRSAYPASIVVLGAFIVYQLYRYSFTHSPMLIALSLFDILVVALIWHEWRLMRSSAE